jgi:hypothetical protein
MAGQNDPLTKGRASPDFALADHDTIATPSSFTDAAGDWIDGRIAAQRPA